MNESREAPSRGSAQRCRDLADDAGRWAKLSSGEEKAGYETSEAKWRKLADHMEAAARIGTAR